MTGLDTPATSTTIDRVMEILTGPMNLEIPSVSAGLFESGILDSVAFVNLLMYLEQTFKITVSVEDLEMDTFQSAASIADFVARELSAAESEVAAVKCGMPSSATQRI